MEGREVLHIVYRSYGGENSKPRPPYYNKTTSLLSLLTALKSAGGPHRVTYINDGPIDPAILSIMHATGEVISKNALGSVGSMTFALRFAGDIACPGSDLIWLAEDDYLYTKDAFRALLEAERRTPRADYFGLYASTGARSPSGAVLPDWAHVPRGWRQDVDLQIEGHVWTRALSTTSTFAARAAALREDRALMEVVMRLGGAWDHTTCLLYQGHFASSWRGLIDHYGTGAGPRTRVRSLGVRAALNAWQTARRLRGAPRRLLIAPQPALSTHLESEHLAQGVDWSRAAQQARAWGAAQGFLAEAEVERGGATA